MRSVIVFVLVTMHEICVTVFVLITWHDILVTVLQYCVIYKACDLCYSSCVIVFVLITWHEICVTVFVLFTRHEICVTVFVLVTMLETIMPCAWVNHNHVQVMESTLQLHSLRKLPNV